MSDIQNYGLQSYFNEDVKFFKDVYIYGSLYAEFAFENLRVKNLDVLGRSNFYGPARFYDNVKFDKSIIIDGDVIAGIITARTRLDVGIGATILTTSTGNIGIGSTIPQQKIDISGSAKIDEFIFDSVNYPGLNGYYLSMDVNGIRWVAVEPSFSEGILVQDEGVYIPTAGLAKSFTALNFTQVNSLGVGVDSIIPVVDPDNPSFIARIQSKDFWGHDGVGNIFRMTNVGIQNSNPTSTLDVSGTLHVTNSVDFDSTLNVDGATVLQSTLNTKGSVDFDSTLNVDGATTLNNTLNTKGEVDFDSSLNVDGATVLQSTLNTKGAVDFDSTLNVDGATTLNNTLEVDGTTVFNNTVELNSSLIDINNNTASGKFDYRLSSVGTGVSWRPPGVQTKRAIWVTIDGNDLNSGLLEGDAKRTVGAAASIAQEGDTIFVRSGVYFENNPIGLRTDVSVSGQDLRLVTIVPNNPSKDVFHVRRGCLIENMNFSGTDTNTSYSGAAAVAFPPSLADINAGKAYGAVSGYLAPGPATEGTSGRWRSPYVRNCTNFMKNSIGMKIDGDHATVTDPTNIGADLKCMVCDSFTQYNENGIGVSITNNGYAQLVSIFTINCDIAIYAASGGSCDLTNSNSSFGNFGLVAVGLGRTEFTATVGTYPPTRTQPGVDAGSDRVTFLNMKDNPDNPGISTVRRPYDGQALFFKIDLSKYPDAVTAGLSTTILQDPMVRVDSIKVTNGGSGYSAASPPTVIIRDSSDLSQQPKGPQGIIAEVSPTIDEVSGAITAIDVINSGRNYLPTQNLEVFIDGGSATAEVITQPIYYAVDVATAPTPVTGITTVTFNEFIPYELFGGEEVSLKRISRILTSSHSFEYIGTGTNINTSTPFKGAVPIKENEIVALEGAQIPFTSTDQKGNFDIGEGFQVNNPTGTIRGRDFSKAIQAEVTPLILALR
jgi:cytoskeletal protein CcmA (bactofilin family)